MLLKRGIEIGSASRIKLVARGGVEDTRLEAKAKDTKKNPRPRTAFSRTNPLEAKDRNARGHGQGPRTQPQVFSKKKGLQKSFSCDLQFIGVPRIFDWGRPKSLITCNDDIKNFPKRKFLWDKDIVGWKICNCCQLARNQNFAKGEGLN